jgi:hypothetical protein
MKRFSHLGFKGKVAMSNPDEVFWIMEDFGFINSKETPMRKVYFARQVTS